MKNPNTKRLKPIIISTILLSLLIGLCFYFQVNKVLTLVICLFGGYLLLKFTKVIIENFFLVNEVDSLETQLEEVEGERINQMLSRITPNSPYDNELPDGPEKHKTNYEDQSKTIKTRLNDIAGYEEAKTEVMEVVDFLKNPAKYKQMGAKLPRGILFEGPPGTGKTLMAKAVAGEAGVKFLATSGSEFVEIYAGKGAAKVRDLFKEARKEPTLIFIDEIDAVGGKRSNAGNDSERERTLNQLLVEMDGFNEDDDVVVIAATNRKDMLDSALLRPGRFERHIFIGLPNIKERLAILNVHAKNKQLDNSIDLNAIAKKTSQFSGAMLASLLNEAALLAVRNNHSTISMVDCEESLDRVLLGPAKKTKEYIERERRLVAYHESGHAVAGLVLDNAKKIERITIVPRGDAGGYNLFSDKEDTFFTTKNMMMNEIVGLLAGRAAEEIMFDDVTSGASNDLLKATSIAHHYVCHYGMSKVGLAQYTALDKISPERQKMIDDEINQILEDCYKVALNLLKTNKNLLTAIAEELLDKETINADEIEIIFAQYNNTNNTPTIAIM